MGPSRPTAPDETIALQYGRSSSREATATNVTLWYLCFPVEARLPVGLSMWPEMFRYRYTAGFVYMVCYARYSSDAVSCFLLEICDRGGRLFQPWFTTKYREAILPPEPGDLDALP